MTLYLVLFAIALAVLAVALAPLLAKPKQAFAVALPMLVGAMLIYAYVGSPKIIPLLAQRNEKLAELKQTILTDSATVKTDPKNLKAWVELGESFDETGQYDAAANAFKQAVIVSGGNPVLILNYGKAMILRDDGKVSDQSKKSMEMVLLQDPGNASAKYYLIVRRLQDGDTKTAMKEMQALYHSLPDDSPLKAMINAQIGRK